MTATNATVTTSQEGGWYQAPFVDARRSAGNTNDLRGKVLRIHVNADGSYTSPAGNLFPQTGNPDDKTRPGSLAGSTSTAVFQRERFCGPWSGLPHS